MTYRRLRLRGNWPVAAMAAGIILLSGCREESTPKHWQTWINARSQPQPSDATVPLTQRRPTGTVGTQACITCHPDEHASYLATTHSRSLRQLDDLPVDELESEFIDPASGRQYQVEIDAGKMIHRETLRGQKDELIAMQEGEIAYEIGSGQHAHSFLLQRDGFLVQSPLTWYAAADRWELSPGFDPTTQATFDRSVSVNCVFCHVGEILTAGNHAERFEIAEQAIGCERCHGPGAQHVELQTRLLGDNPLQAETNSAEPGDQIINPARLSRELSEAVCAQCHLQGIVASSSAGSSRWDFRPGEPLTQTSTEYQLQGAGAPFRIVGHTEQMHDSQCYQQTTVLTCITCHDPHHNPAAAATKQRDLCATCHADDACHVPLETRLTTQQNNCVTCHMPRRETNVPHAALHDHRIAVHEESFSLASLAVPLRFTRDSEPPEGSGDGRVRLQPIDSDAELPAWQVKRRAALALHSLAFNGQLPAAMQSELQQAKSDLLDLYREGHRDANLEVALAMDYLAAGQHATAEKLARDALKQSAAGDVGYLGAADVLAKLALHDQDNSAARKWYRELTLYRRVSGDYVMLAVCENNAGDRQAAIQALETALSIDPTLLFAHELMVEILAADGQPLRSEAHRRAVIAIRAAGPRLPNEPGR